MKFNVGEGLQATVKGYLVVIKHLGNSCAVFLLDLSLFGPLTIVY